MLTIALSEQDEHEEEEGLAEDVLGVGEVDAEDVDAVEAEERRSGRSRRRSRPRRRRRPGRSG